MRIAVLVSGHGRGTNFQAIIDAHERGEFAAEIAVLVSASADAGAVDRAVEHGIETLVVDPKRFALEQDYFAALARELLAREIGLVCLAGYMRQVAPDFIREFPNRIMNIHPALLPAFGGKGMYGIHVHEAVIESGAKFTGVTVHFADAEYDHGPIILQRVVPVDEDDTPESLAARVLKEEHRLYAEAIRLFAENRLKVTGKRVRIV
ncbi:MAG: phosphoribosylglycinamide formyltransferase [Armatimonadetes bacterium CG2_30_59_28]|nr:phosphoribosylglycinamide formyltransferase [Armatimonadota bacterium]OIO89548.1 MAG: phosphoribosylglycinamide formyltransferase [Armatimonadetes bacterium CG2_30_59_28]PIU60295.1 MAG: phosphoribosylglycinamide formyltransferase [Armatimonadetes bacterium CG07_land_8_20_14_0_80_59_28]PIX44335.1 MAG: phosphoribosylglycinamide formyltransferase [Armatimonadetes bacterium CG_4_8_14_3_um_filter_58_9]PIY49380.1 MAG: phosphoribosylglycinamide formyltransferase [Armatimonadetes bacterium CG_4_10_1